MKKTLLTAVLVLLSSSLFAQDYKLLSMDSFLTEYQALDAPTPSGLLLKKGDRLAICGDSITEQKMYSRIIETYLTVCVPQLDIKVRQYGWGGETAKGFLARMKNDCLRFNPTIATTCYGMNDHRYQPYKDEYGNEYRNCTTEIVKLFKANDCRVILGSPGCVGKKPGWQKDKSITADDLNKSLLKFRNIDIEIAAQQNVDFADIYGPMFLSRYKAQTLYGSDFKVAGNDGVHPDWAGHLIMAYAFLNAMGLDGQIAAITYDFETDKATVSDGHKITNADVGQITIQSSRYPYCDNGVTDMSNSIRAGMTLVPFNQELNRFMLVVTGTASSNYKVVWGDHEKTYTAAQINEGVNLAEDFALNPFTDAFNAVYGAVGQKQKYETTQIKNKFHGDEGKADMEATVVLTEKTRKPLADNIEKAFVPVTHTIKIIPE